MRWSGVIYKGAHEGGDPFVKISASNFEAQPPYNSCIGLAFSEFVGLASKVL